jgi:hypothetical protein
VSRRTCCSWDPTRYCHNEARLLQQTVPLFTSQYSNPNSKYCHNVACFLQQKKLHCLGQNIVILAGDTAIMWYSSAKNISIFDTIKLSFVAVRFGISSTLNDEETTIDRGSPLLVISVHISESTTTSICRLLF